MKNITMNKYDCVGTFLTDEKFNTLKMFKILGKNFWKKIFSRSFFKKKFRKSVVENKKKN
jgi:hypothetical protein